MKKHFEILITSVFVCMLICCATGNLKATEPEPVYKYTFDFLGEDMMPIGSFCGDITRTENITEENFATFAKSGLNLLIGSPVYAKQINQTLSLCDKNNMVCLVYDPNIAVGTNSSEYIAANFESIKKYKSFCGVYIVDEPGTVRWNELGMLHNNFQKALPDKLYYINIIPDYADQEQLINGAGGGMSVDAGMTYEKHVDSYLEKVKPPILSYDWYPMMKKYPDIQAGYFKQMALIADRAQKHRIPFWVCIQTVSWMDEARVCTLPELLWQVNTALGYGCKGIQYYRYWSYVSQCDRTNEQIGAPVSKTGEIQPMYYHMQKANKQIAAVSKVLINSTFKGWIKNGNFPAKLSPDEIPAKDLLAKYEVLNSVSGDDCLVGCFNHHGQPAYYVVNNSITKENASIKLDFSKKVGLDITIDGITKQENSKNVVLTLAAGNAALITIK